MMIESEAPLFSVVIPTYNRPERLDRCLAAIALLEYPRDRFEVIVVDDGSSTPLDEVVAPYRHLALTLHHQTNSGPGAARNTGANLACGDYLAFTDDDCTPAPDWLRQFARCFAANPRAMVGGYTSNALPDNPFSTASQILSDYLYEYYNTQSRRGQFFASNNLAVPRDLFREVGGFDRRFPLAAAEDREFCDRWLQLGYGMVYAPQAQVAHAHHLALPSYWRQHFNYGRGAYYFHLCRDRRNAPPQPIEPQSFYWRMFAYPFVNQSSQPGVLLALLLFLSQVAGVSGFFWERSRFSRQQRSSSALPTK